MYWAVIIFFIQLTIYFILEKLNFWICKVDEGFQIRALWTTYQDFSMWFLPICSRCCCWVILGKAVLWCTSCKQFKTLINFLFILELNHQVLKCPLCFLLLTHLEVYPELHQDNPQYDPKLPGYEKKSRQNAVLCNFLKCAQFRHKNHVDSAVFY